MSAEVAWNVLTDYEHMSSLLGGLSLSKIISRQGNTWVVRQERVVRYGLLAFSFFSEREMRLESIRHIQVKSLSGTLKSMASETTIIPQDHSVQIKYHAESVPDSWLARMFGAGFVRHEIEEQFMALANEMMRRDSRKEPAELPAR